MNIFTDLIKTVDQQTFIWSFNVGDYVFLAKHRDANPHDPWFIGTVDEVGIDHKGCFIRCYESGNRTWRNAVKIEKETGDRLLKELKAYR